MSAMDVDFEDLQEQANTSTSASLHPETAKILAELDRKASSRQIAVPTRDDQVRIRLRELGHPVTLFGEWPEDRRDRLRQLWNSRGVVGVDEAMDTDSDDDERNEEFYTEGTTALKNARMDIAKYSIPRSAQRVNRQKIETALPLGRLMAVRKSVFAHLKTFTNLGSQIGDTRALSSIRFSPNSEQLLVGSWDGNVKLWSVPDCKEMKFVRAHKDRVGGVAWFPEATLSQPSSALSFASSGADGQVKLWSIDNDAPLHTLTGHTARVSRIAFHPSGKYLGSASYDTSWRLWDTETGKELLLQEGHSKEVYTIEFQDDGALVGTGGLDAIARVWDLRSGKSAMVLDGHVKDILSLDFSPNGYQIATGSTDDTIRIWDVRTLKTLKTIPAHRSSVSDVRFYRGPRPTYRAVRDISYPDTYLSPGFQNLEPFASQSAEQVPNGTSSVGKYNYDPAQDIPLSGTFLISGGYDGRINIWSAEDWLLVSSLAGETGGKIMSVDISKDAKFIASAEYSRTFKLWSSPDVDF